MKLDCGIIHSSLWAESSDTKICWITLLLLADPNGFVRAAPSAIAREAGIPAEVARKAISLFCSPDNESRSPENQGKRIERVEGGFHILNYEKYRERDYTNAERQKRWRESQRSNVTSVTEPLPITPRNTSRSRVQKQKEEGEASVKRMPTGRNGLPDSEWIASLKEDKTYAGIDIDRELGKMQQWCSIRQLTPTRRRFINWLNRAEKPISGNGSMSPQHRQNRINFLNEKKQKTNRQIKDPNNPPSWAVTELEKIDAELKKL